VGRAVAPEAFAVALASGAALALAGALPAGAALDTSGVISTTGGVVASACPGCAALVATPHPATAIRPPAHAHALARTPRR
jgi:hypothetical protein